MTYLWAALSGLLSFLTMPAWLTGVGTAETSWFSLPWLTFVATVPLLVVTLRETSWRKRFRLGWLTGTVTLAFMQHHIADTLMLMSGVPWWAAMPCMLVYSAWAGLPWAILAAIAQPARERLGDVRALAVLATVAVLLERQFPVLFPFYSSSGFFDVAFMLQPADVIGIAGISLLIQLVRVALALAVVMRLEGRRPSWRPLAAVGVLWLAAIGYSARRLPAIESAPVRTTLDLLTIQPNVSVAQKTANDPRVREGVYAATVTLTTDAIRAGGKPGLVLWPEGGFPFVYEGPPVPEKPNRPQRYSQRLRSFARGLGVDFVAGGLARSEGGRASNSALFFGASAGGSERYDKQLLLMFGEHIPFADWFPGILDALPGMSHHVPGTHFVKWTAAGVRLAPTICYEAVFQDFTREAVNVNDAELILNLTNEVWFGETTASAQHAMVQSARAVELRRWMVRSANNALSMFIAPSGAIVAQTGVGVAGVLRGTLAIPDLPPTVFATIGDTFLWLWTAASALIVGLGLRRRRGA